MESIKTAAKASTEFRSDIRIHVLVMSILLRNEQSSGYREVKQCVRD
jgi:hypothetical protein